MLRWGHDQPILTKEADMAGALGAIKEFFHHVADDWSRHHDSSRPVRTILDVLAPPAPQV